MEGGEGGEGGSGVLQLRAVKRAAPASRLGGEGNTPDSCLGLVCFLIPSQPPSKRQALPRPPHVGRSDPSTLSCNDNAAASSKTKKATRYSYSPHVISSAFNPTIYLECFILTLLLSPSAL
jgi:hypothetical protein